MPNEMKLRSLFFLLVALATSASAQINYSKINSLPIRNTPASTDSIPVETSGNQTYRVLFSKFGGGGTGSGNVTGPLTSTVGQLAEFNSTDGTTLKGATGSGLLSISSGVPGTPITTSAGLAGVITDESGTGVLVFNNSPLLITPNLGTPSAVNLANATGMPLGGITGLGSNMAAFLATPSSANLRAALTDETGTGPAVFGTSPSLTTPVLGVATATSINGATIPKSGAALVGDDVNLSGGTVLTEGEHYYDTLSAARTITFTGSHSLGGNATVLRLNVTGGPQTLTFPASNRVGYSSPVTSLSLPVGYQELSWTYTNAGGSAGYLLIDTVPDVTGLVQNTLTVAGHALNANVVINMADLAQSDVTTNNFSSTAHGFAPKSNGNPAYYLDGSGNFSIPAGAANPTQTIDRIEEFMGGALTDGSIGSLGWRTTGAGSYTVTAGFAAHPGIINLSTGTTSGTTAGLYLSPDGSTLPLIGTDRWTILFILHFNALDSSTTIRFGVGNGTTGAPTEGAYFEHLGTDTNFFGEARTVANAATRVDTLYTPSTGGGVYPTFRVRRITTNVIGFQVNNGTEKTITTSVGTNDPELPLTPFIQVINSSAAAKTIDLDYLEIQDAVSR